MRFRITIEVERVDGPSCNLVPVHEGPSFRRAFVVRADNCDDAVERIGRYVAVNNGIEEVDPVYPPEVVS